MNVPLTRFDPAPSAAVQDSGITRYWLRVCCRYYYGLAYGLRQCDFHRILPLGIILVHKVKGSQPCLTDAGRNPIFTCLCGHGAWEVSRQYDHRLLLDKSQFNQFKHFATEDYYPFSL
jgi:hypothetical protein